MSEPGRLGVTVPLRDVPPDRQHAEIRALVAAGYTDIWSSETNRNDAMTPLAAVAATEPTARLGTAIASVFAWGPALLATSAAHVADLAPGRFLLGIGSSSPAIVTGWNGLPFESPFRRTRDVLRFLRSALAGERVSGRFDTFEVQGFQLGRPPRQAPPILLAALRPRMLALAGDEADGAITNWLAADDVPRVREAMDGTKELVARIFVLPIDDADEARRIARRSICSYLTVPGYADFHRWLGRADALTPMWDAWARGDRARANIALPNEVVDELVVHGTPEQCRAHIDRYVAAGATPVLSLLLPPSADHVAAYHALARA